MGHLIPQPPLPGSGMAQGWLCCPSSDRPAFWVPVSPLTLPRPPASVSAEPRASCLIACIPSTGPQPCSGLILCPLHAHLSLLQASLPPVSPLPAWPVHPQSRPCLSLAHGLLWLPAYPGQSPHLSAGALHALVLPSSLAVFTSHVSFITSPGSHLLFSRT